MKKHFIWSALFTKHLVWMAATKIVRGAARRCGVAGMLADALMEQEIELRERHLRFAKHLIFHGTRPMRQGSTTTFLVVDDYGVKRLTDEEREAVKKLFSKNWDTDGFRTSWQPGDVRKIPDRNRDSKKTN